MAFDPCFLELMASDVTVVAEASTDEYGKATLSGTSTVVPAKVTYEHGVTYNREGETIGFSASVHVPPPGYVPPGYDAVPTINLSDTFTLPDSSTRRVISITSPIDEDGDIHHQRVRLTG